MLYLLPAAMATAVVVLHTAATRGQAIAGKASCTRSPQMPIVIQMKCLRRNYDAMKHKCWYNKNTIVIQVLDGAASKKINTRCQYSHDIDNK